MDRNINIQRVRERAEPWDIVVIGGGATGAGCALDAASRGYSVLLLEQHDFGKGTSSRSTKLIHGGVRYLRQGNISLVRESLRERALLLKNAPHVVHEQEFVIPCYSTSQKYFYGLGMRIYDMLAGSNKIGRSKILDRDEVLQRLPNINAARLEGGVVYYDGQFDDTRLLIDILQTADTHGAVVLNYARVTGLGKTLDGKIRSVEFVDEESGEVISVRANSVINATGAFCNAVGEMSGRNSKPHVTYSQGVHLIFDRKFFPGDSALLIPKTKDGRVLFCIPWHEHLLVGTTDTPVEEPTLEPRALETEIDFIIETAAQYLAAKPARSDILSAWAGIRPLVKRGSRSKTSSLSRGHELFVDGSGLVTITGGKWTTYRRMAEDAVNKAIDIGELEKHACMTATLTIAGPESNVSETVERLHPDLPYTRDDVVDAVRNEMARTVEDVLARRTRAVFLNARAAIEIAPTVAKIMADELEMDEGWVAGQVAAFRETAKSYSIH